MLKEIEPGAFGRLLDLQEEDSAIQRLEHRLSTLPEARRLAELNEQLAELSADLEIATKQSEEVAREQDRLEGEIGLLDQKIQREEQRMFSGGVSNPKELSALQAEVESLKRKKSGLEDGLLEVMVQREQADENRGALENERAQTATLRDETARIVESLGGEIDAQLKEHRIRRGEIAPTIPEPLLSLYDQLREQKHGVGAARLEGSTCSGCHTKLPAVEVERVRAEGGLQRCDNCRRILVV